MTLEQAEKIINKLDELSPGREVRAYSEFSEGVRSWFVQTQGHWTPDVYSDLSIVDTAAAEVEGSGWDIAAEADQIVAIIRA